MACALQKCALLSTPPTLSWTVAFVFTFASSLFALDSVDLELDSFLALTCAFFSSGFDDCFSFFGANPDPELLLDPD